MNLIYGLKNGEITTINEVESGLKCDCICPNCKKKLIAKKGEIREHHFAHINSIDCMWRGESLIHKISKKIIENSNSLKLPKVTLKKIPEVTIYDEKVIRITKAKSEKKIGNFIPDIIVESNKKKLLVEIYYSHGVDYNKLNKIRELKIPSIEIDVSKIVKSLYNKNDFFLKSNEFKNFLINNTSNKRWIYNPEQERIHNIITQKYSENHFIDSFDFKHYEGYIETFTFSEFCPINKSVWKNGLNKGQPYAKIEDCYRCKYFNKIEKKILLGAKSKEIIRESASVNCTGHLSSSLQTDFIIAVNKHKKKIN